MGTETAQNPTPTTTPATDASPFHVIPGHETIQAAPKSVYQVGPSGAAHGKAGSMGSAVPEKSFIGENIDKLTEPIENYTPAGREAHPILSRLGDVTRGVKELLEGGQTPMGAKSGVLNNPATAFILPENQEMVGEGLAAKGEEGLAQAARGEKGLANTAAKAEELAREYAPKVASHLAETGHNFLTGILEDARAGLEATAPEGSTEAGFAKIPGYRKEGPAPELPKKPKAVTKPAKLKPPVEVNSDAEATKKAEDDLAAARANYVHDMEKNPTTFPKGTPVHEQVVNVDPNKVIAKVNPGGNTFDEPTVQKYQRMIRNGEDIPAARIEYGKTGDVRGYDGRHRVEAARREGVPVKLWTRREVEPGEAPPTTIGYEEPQVHELNGDEGAPPDAVGVHPDDLPRQARYQDVNWEAPDLQDTGKRVNEQTIRTDYASGSTKPSIYQSYIPMEDLPTGSVNEDFDREDYRAPRNGGSPIKVQVNPDNSLEILDGNHRAITWDEQDKTHAPAWVVDYRHPNIENISEDEKAERAEEAEAQATAPEAEEGAYHPDLQKVVDKYGETEEPYKIGNGASFITPEGKFVHGGSTTHEQMIGEKDKGGFVDRTNAIRTRVSNDRRGHTLHVTVPVNGVNPDQVDALKAGAREALGSGKSGNIVMETANGQKSATHEFANANNIEPMLKEIGAHPDKTPTEAPNWNEKAAQLHEQNGGFTINPRTGAVPESGHIVEAVPEARQVSDKPNTPEQIQKYADSKPVKKLLAKYPELQIGGYKNDAGKYELNLSAISNDSAKAAKVAKALDQESVYNAGEGKVVPTGGKNTQQKFPDYTIAQRLRDLAPEEPGMTISTRQPSSVKYSTEDPLRHNLRLTDDLINKNPALADKWAEAVKSYPGFQAPEGADTPTVLNAFIEHAKDNLKHLYNSLPPEEQEKNKVWYDGAHQLTKDLADKHDLTHPQTAGIVAALSPQKDWDQNVSLARRLTSIMKNQQNTKASPEMLAKAKDIKDASWTKQNPQANDYLVSLAKKIQGKTLGELKDPMQKAAFVRLHDEVNNPREYFKINPDGSNAGVYTKADGTKGKVAWGPLDEIGKGINISEDGSRDNLSANLGQAHKVRHFYNNIIEPNSARGDVTVDTHAVAAALMRALSGKNDEVLANFGAKGGAGSNIHGLNGTYPLYHEAYTRAAKELDIAHPRQLQSVVWEHIRNLFPAEFKTKENQAAIDGIWKEAQNGQITAEDARNKIIQYAKEHSAGSDETEQHPADQSELFGNSVHGESAGGRGRGDRGVNPVGNQETRPAESNAKAGSGWLKMMQSASPKKNEFLK